MNNLVLYQKYKHWLKGESLEQANLVLWLETNDYKFTSIPNSTWTKSFKQKILNTITGLRPGLSDMVIILKRGSLLFIELKKTRTRKKNGEFRALSSDGIVVSPEQEIWKGEFNKIENVQCEICYGADEAINFIKNIDAETY